MVSSKEDQPRASTKRRKPAALSGSRIDFELAHSREALRRHVNEEDSIGSAHADHSAAFTTMRSWALPIECSSITPRDSLGWLGSNPTWGAKISPVDKAAKHSPPLSRLTSGSNPAWGMELHPSRASSAFDYRFNELSTTVLHCAGDPKLSHSTRPPLLCELKRRFN